MAATPQSARQSKMTDKSISVASEVVSLATDQTKTSLTKVTKRVKSDKGIFKATPHSDMPSLTASIPSKYQTFFTSSSEPHGFNSCSSRFDSSHDLINDNPGPGTYREGESLAKMSKTNSFSKKGTAGLASKTKRFPRRRHTYNSVGPASYYPSKLPLSTDFNRAHVSRNFHLPLVKPIAAYSQGPAPNTYHLSSNWSTGSAFRSTSKRVGVLANTAIINNPGPSQYSPNYTELLPSACSQTANFLSTSNREFPCTKDQQGGPGPADYSPNSSKKSKKHTPGYRYKHYLCMSAPAIPLPPIPPSPGPGHYDLVKQDPTQLVSGAVFKSTSSRWSKPLGNEAPGPGAYDPRKIGKQSFFYNMNHQWV